MLKNTNTEYGSIAKLFHWVIAILIIIMLIIGFSFIITPSFQPYLISIHKSLGVTILILLSLRLLWRIFNAQPQLSRALSRWERVLSCSVHFLLYLFVFSIIISGVVLSSAAGRLISFWGLFEFKLPIIKNHQLAYFSENLHLIFAWILLGLIVLHVLAAFKHYLFNKDQVMQRMLPLSMRNKKFLFR